MNWDVVLPAIIGGGLFTLLTKLAELYSGRSKAVAEAHKDMVEAEGTAAAQWQSIASDIRISDEKHKIENDMLRENMRDLQRRFDALQIIVMDLLAGLEVTNREIVRLGGTVWTPHVTDEMIAMAIGEDNGVLNILRNRLVHAETDMKAGAKQEKTTVSQTVVEVEKTTGV